MENNDHCNVQVKQSAALPSGSNEKNPGKPQAISFDIHPGKIGRQTHIYVFAWHPESDPDVADHRDPGQWRFCVMPEDELPEAALKQKTQRISLKRLEALAASIRLKRSLMTNWPRPSTASPRSCWNGTKETAASPMK